MVRYFTCCSLKEVSGLQWMTDLLTKAKERMRTRSMYRYCQSPRFDSYCEGSGGEEGRREGGEMDRQHKNMVIAVRNS